MDDKAVDSIAKTFSIETAHVYLMFFFIYNFKHNIQLVA